MITDTCNYLLILNISTCLPAYTFGFAPQLASEKVLNQTVYGFMKTDVIHNEWPKYKLHTIPHLLIIENHRKTTPVSTRFTVGYWCKSGVV